MAKLIKPPVLILHQLESLGSEEQAISLYHCFFQVLNTKLNLQALNSGAGLYIMELPTYIGEPQGIHIPILLIVLLSLLLL